MKLKWSNLTDFESSEVKAKHMAREITRDIELLYEKSVALRAEYEKLATSDLIERRKQNTAAMLTALRLVRHLARETDKVGFDCPKCGNHVLEVRMVPHRGACAIRVGGEVCCEDVSKEFI